MPEAAEARFRGFLPWVMVVEERDLSLLGCWEHCGTTHEKMKALERMTSKLDVQYILDFKSFRVTIAQQGVDFLISHSCRCG